MDQFSKSLPMMLHHVLDVIIPRYRAVFKEYNLSEQQWRILRVLWEAGECTTAELARQTLLPSPSMVGIIDRMIKKELIIRVRNKQDRRIVNLSLTDKGKRLESKLLPKVDAIYADIMSQCDNESWDTMINTLQVIIDTQLKTKTNNTPARAIAMLTTREYENG